MLIWMHQALDVVNNEVNKTMNKAEVLDYLSYAAAMVSCFLPGLWLCLPCSIYTLTLKFMSCSSYPSLPSLIILPGTMVGPWEDLYKLMLFGRTQRVMILLLVYVVVMVASVILFYVNGTSGTKVKNCCRSGLLYCVFP